MMCKLCTLAYFNQNLGEEKIQHEKKKLPKPNIIKHLGLEKIMETKRSDVNFQNQKHLKVKKENINTIFLTCLNK